MGGVTNMIGTMCIKQNGDVSMIIMWILHNVAIPTLLGVIHCQKRTLLGPPSSLPKAYFENVDY